MTEYRRIYIPGAIWFFTVNLAERKGNKLLVENIELLRGSFIKVQQSHPFKIIAIVILPDHLHCILSLPEEKKVTNKKKVTGLTFKHKPNGCYKL